jgi:hypothetical protein
MGALGGMAGGGLPGLGKVNDAQALQDQGQMEKASEARMRYGIEKQNRDALLKQTMMQIGSQAALERERIKAMTSMYGADSRATTAAEKLAAGSGTNQKLSAAEEAKAMFLDQAHQQLQQAQAMGVKFLPSTGIGGTAESFGRFARGWGMPQLLDNDELARQSIASAIAEPIVRAESGAAVPESEVKRLSLRYIPLPGESRVEQARKLRSLVGAIGSIRQGLPAWKAAEFAPKQAAFQAWADSLDPAGKAGGEKKTIVRRGTDESGRRVVQYSDGTVGPE